MAQLWFSIDQMKLSMKTKLITLFCFIVSLVSYSQIKLSGSVVDGQQQPIDFAEILLLTTQETVVQHTYTDESGAFIFDRIAADSYILRVTNLGKKQYETQLTLTQDQKLAPFIIQNDNLLDEIVIAKQAKVFERKVDRTIFNIEQSIHANNSNAKDLLKLTPGLKVEKDQISLIGKSSMQVMINDKLLPLSGEELISYLNTIPSETIQKIEIISTPPAKYEASGNSGLINIVLKQAKHNAWNNQISAGFEGTDKALWKVSDVFNYSKNKVSIAASVHASRGYNQEIGKMDLYYPTETWKTVYRETKQNKDLSGTFQLDYQVTPKTGIGFQYRGNTNSQKTTDKNQVDVYNLVDNLLKNIDTKGKSSPDFNNQALNLNFAHKFDTVGTKMNIDLDYFNYNTDKFRVFNTNTRVVDNVVNKDPFAQTSGDQKIDNYSAKIDMEQPLSFVNLSYGAKASFVQTINNAHSSNINRLTSISNILQEDHFVYKENIQAVYVSATKAFGKKWETQVGLRIESTQTTGESKATETTEKTTYTKLFPTLFVSYKVNEDNTLSFSANRRINRPSFWQLNPFRWYVNDYNYVTGDPTLQPTYINTVSVNYTFKNKLFIQASHSKVTNLFSQYSNIDTVNNIQILKQGNIFDATNSNISVTHIFDTWHWLSSQNTFSAFYNSSTLIQDVQVETKDGMGYYFNSNNTLQLNADKTLQAQVDFWYQSKLNNGNWKLRPMYGLNLGVKYAMLDKKLHVSAYMNDLLRTSNLRAQATSDGVKQQYNMYSDNRYFTLGLSYSFGNSKIKVTERQGSNKDIINRK